MKTKKIAAIQMVVVRAELSGVWYGRLVKVDSLNVRLEGARRIWQWDEGALSCSEIALTGVKKGTISPPVNVTLLRRDCVEIIDANNIVLP